MGVEAIEDINWDLIKNKRKADENRIALENYIKVVDIYSVKSFNEVLSAVKEEIEMSLFQNDDKETKEFKKELKEKNNRNIIHVYNHFLKRKRKHS